MLTPEILANHGLTRINSKNYINFNKNFPCPVCGNTEQGKCGLNIENLSIHCFKGDSVENKTIIIEETNYDVFESQSGGWNVKPRSKSLKISNNSKVNNKVTPIPVQENRVYNVELTHLFYETLIERLSLSENHREFCETHWALPNAKQYGIRTKNYKIVNELIDEIQNKSETPDKIYEIAGIAKSEKTGRPYFQVFHDDILIPIVQNDKIVGVQARNVDRIDQNPYFVAPTSTNNRNFSFSQNLPCADLNNQVTVYVDESITKSVFGAKYFDCGASMGFVGFRKANDEQALQEMEIFFNENGFFDPKIIIGFDKDNTPKIRQIVQQTRETLATNLYIMGYTVYFAEWESKNGEKGIDDAIRAGLDIKLVEFKPTKREVKMTEKKREQFKKDKRDVFDERNNKAMSVNQAQNLISAKIYKILSDGKQTIINADTGIGKTTQLPYAIFSFLNDADRNNQKVKIGVFLKTYKHVEDFNILLNQFAEFEQEIFIFHGRNEDNCDPTQLKLVEIAGKNGHNVQETVCKTCPLHNSCKENGYLSQFEKIKMKRVIVATHASIQHLVNDQGVYDKQSGNLTHIIIDEDPIDQFWREKVIMRDIVRDTRLNFEVEHENLKNLLISVKSEIGQFQVSESIKGIQMTIKVLLAIENVANDLFKMNNGTNHQESFHINKLVMDNLFDKLVTKNDIEMAYNFVMSNTNGKTHTSQFEREKIENLVWIRDFINCFYEWFLKGDSKDIIYFEKTKNNVFIKLKLFNNDLLTSFSKKITVVLDATANKIMWNKICKNARIPAFDFEEIPLKIDTNAIKTVYFDAINKTMKGMGEDSDKIKNSILALAKLHENKKIGLIVTKLVYEKIKDKLPENVLIGYYGRDNFGSNKFKEVDVFFLTNYQVNITSQKEKYEILTGNIVNENSVKRKYMPNFHVGVYNLKEKYINGSFREFLQDEAQGIIYQTVQRVRLSRRTENKPVTVYYAGNIENWSDQLPVFDEVVGDELKNEQKRVSGRIGAEATKVSFARKFAKKIEKSIVNRLNGKEISKVNVKQVIRKIINDRNIIKKISYEIGMDERTIKKHFESCDFIEFIEGMLVEQEIGKLAKSKEKVNVKRIVYSVENILNMIIRALLIRDDRKDNELVKMVV